MDKKKHIPPKPKEAITYHGDGVEYMIAAVVVMIITAMLIIVFSIKQCSCVCRIEDPDSTPINVRHEKTVKTNHYWKANKLKTT